MNLNDHVRVRLTEYGQRILKSYVDDQLRVFAGNKADAISSDADGIFQILFMGVDVDFRFAFPSGNGNDTISRI